MNRLLVLCVDRDNDLGKKTGIKGPVIGREAVLEAATKLALADPGETDANTMFAAVKKFDEVSKATKKAAVVALTGYGKIGFKSDQVLNQQLDAVIKRFRPKGFVLVTDGAEDDQIIPILQSRAKIVSKETVIVRQAQQIESAFFTIKEFFKDPFIRATAFGLPGIAILLYALLGVTGVQIIMFVLGAALLLFGFGIAQPIIDLFSSVTGSISVQRPSFPFYVGSLFILGFGVITAYSKFSMMQITEPLIDATRIAQSTYMFIVLAAISVVVGRCIDVLHRKKAFLLRRYLLTAVSVVLLGWILDTGTQVFLRMADLNWFLMTILGSFIILLITFRLSEIIDVREKITKLLIDLPVYSADGTWLGRVSGIDRRKRAIQYTDSASSKPIEVYRGKFKVAEGKITVSS